VTAGLLPRDALLARLQQDVTWDLAVIGGGATGLGVALDATARGFRVVLIESHDFAQGTSSRATKLAHGGVRYLAQGDVGLVHEALQERGAMLANAPHVAQRLAFVMPGYQWWGVGFYGVGLKAYDVLAGRRGLGSTELLSARDVRELLPTVRRRGLAGGVKYWDGQFDDARLAMLLARTAAARGALLVNHIAVTGLVLEGGRVAGLTLQDRAPGNITPPLTVRARCVVNAAGVWVDAVRDMDREPGAPQRPAMVAPSQGVHLVVDRRFLPGHHALLVPKTEDGRVLFAVPWLGKTILGTTDTPRQDLARDPVPFHDEVEFILREAGRYLESAPTRADVRSVWVGLRPLVKPTADEGAGGDSDAASTTAAGTKSISREHTVVVGRSGLVTVTGGKWTTYRAMAEDVLERAMACGLLDRRPGGVTERLPLMGAAPGRPLTEAPGEHLYGSEAALLRSLPGAESWLWRDAESGQGGLSEAMVRFAARYEMAQGVEDVLARRCRLLFLDAAEAARQADAVAAILADELGEGFDATASAAAFRQLAAQYQHLP
jgi:glycerol-3-phosphate dehydrogenase